MALTRKFLSALGIESDKIDEIIFAHSETVTALKEQRDNYKADAEKLPGVQQELDALKADKSKDEPFEQKYNDLKAEYDTYKADVATKEIQGKKKSAYRALLKDAGVSEKRVDAILKVTNLDDITLEEDGSIKDADKITGDVKTEWADFIVDTQQKGAQVKRPPKNDGSDGDHPSRAAELARKYHENLYGKVKEE